MKSNNINSMNNSFLLKCVLGSLFLFLFFVQVDKVEAASVFLSADGGAVSEVSAGDTVRLSYEVNGLSDCSIDNGVGAIDNGDLPLGFVDITAPAVTSRIYTITCEGVEDSVSLKMTPGVSLSVDSTPVSVDGSGSADVDLTWTSSLANSCDTLTRIGVSGAVTDVAISGSANDTQTVSVTESSTFYLTCSSVNGLNSTDSVLVEVDNVSLPAPEITTFAAAKNSVELDEVTGRASAYVSWSTSNVEECVRSAEDLGGSTIIVDNWSGGNTAKVDGAYFVSLTESTVLLLNCGRISDGEYTQLSQTITVTTPAGGLQAPTVSLTADTPVSLDYAIGGVASSLATPVVTGVDTCTYTATKVSNGSPVSVDGWTNRSTDGSFNEAYDINTYESVNLHLSCERSADNAVAADSATVIVSAPAGPTASISATDVSVTSDASGIAYTTINWSSSNVTSCPVFEAVTDNGTRYIYNTDDSVSGGVLVPVYMDTTFSMSCDRVSDDLTASDSISVSFSGVTAPAVSGVGANECYDVASGAVITIPAGASADADDFCLYNYELTGDDGGGGTLAKTYTPPCAFAPAPGRTIVDFNIHPGGGNNNVVSSVGWKWHKTLPEAVSLSAGSYVVRVHNRDAYYFYNGSTWVDRATSNPNSQDSEMTQVRFYTSLPSDNPASDEDIARSSFTPDLPDNVREAEFIGITDTELVLPSDVTHIQSWHKGAPDSSTSVSSVRPVCVAFDSALPTITLETKNDTDGDPYAEVGQLTIDPGDEVSIQWDVEGADTCTAVAGTDFSVGGSVSGEDSDITEPVSGASELYTIRCENANGSVSESVLVNAGQVFDTVQIESEKQIVQRGEEVDIVWEVDPRLEPFCSLNTEGLVGTVDFSAGSGSLVTTPVFSEREYTLDCGLGGSDTVYIRALPQILEY